MKKIVISVIIASLLIFILLLAVIQIPTFGDVNNPAHNEVMKYYLENGINDTGAKNVVTSIILEYRGFDTFGEACVLFVGVILTLMILQDKTEKKKNKIDNNIIIDDQVLKVIARFIIPFVQIFAIYIVLFGHLSPGGGFAGGTIFAASIILLRYSFPEEDGFRTNTIQPLVVIGMSMIVYAIVKSYSFFTGHEANHSLFTVSPGEFLGAGTMMLLNTLIAIVVTCSMVILFDLFLKGEDEK